MRLTCASLCGLLLFTCFQVGLKSNVVNGPTMSSKQKSLADKISGLLNTAPSFNPDENDLESAAKVVEYEEDAKDANETSAPKPSAFRNKNVSLLDEVDDKYAGKKSSRKDLCDSDDDLQSQYIDQASSTDGDEDLETEEEEDDDGEDDQDDLEEDDGDDASFRHMNETNVKAISRKGQCVQNQIRIWESLLEMRIQLQKCLVASNKLPVQEVYRHMHESSNFQEKSECLKGTLSNTLGNLMELQELLIKKYPESKRILKYVPAQLSDSKTHEEQVEEDDEVPSESENESNYEDDDDDDSSEYQPNAKVQKLSIHELEAKANNLHESYKNFRNNTIQKWNDKTQMAHGKVVNSNSVLAQIEFNLSNKTRLIKRTQLKRSEYRILGIEEETTGIETPETEQHSDYHEYNNNIFDDDDFYHQLLRELIEVKSADITDPIQLSRQWIQLQNMRSKMKRKIDTKATKGRKIRYGVHTKLVNFMAPMCSEAITDEAQTELFTSLFGKKIC